jgi:hypothetical protein
MKTSTCKAKGRRLQQEIVAEILAYFPELSPRDVVSLPMGCSGKDIMLSEEAIKSVPFAIEAKCQESLNIWSALKQTEQDNRDKDLIPLLVFRRNNTERYCSLKFSDFMNMVKKLSEYKKLYGEPK